MQVDKEIEELQEKLLNATRTESRWINQRLSDLNRKRNVFEDELVRFDIDVQKKQ